MISTGCNKVSGTQWLHETTEATQKINVQRNNGWEIHTLKTVAQLI